ncbi:leucine-rich_repeat domain-containing protein [Hexamita inflata]|uniref:Leucine-rich_repeat domain-containing protein n=1 Tax=Hexamita inflata TaxID=28002 RepID=A0ABP1GE51_9EUKA
MIEKYQSKIEDGKLTIHKNPDLKGLNFINTLKINQLVLYDCQNIVPQLESQTIKELKIMDCDIQSVKDFQLENLEILEVYNNFGKLESKTLTQDSFSTLSKMIGLTELVLMQCNLRSTEALSQLINLENLYLNGNEEIDIKSLQYQTKLTKLSLEQCKLVNIDALRPLINLEELCLNGNDIDITTVQYLTKLTLLSLVYCNLVNIDVLRPLKKLKELDITDNNIVYLRPLLELKQLFQLDTSYNKIIDTESIQLHPNFDNFLLDDQDEPTQEQLEVANMMRDINNQISSLKQICIESSRIKEINKVFRKKITQQLQVSYNSHEQFVARSAILFQKINVFDGYQ